MRYNPTMRRRQTARAVLLVALLAALAPARPAAACLWDYDTLRDEQRGLPSVAAVLAGRWERHSDFFYEARADAMRKRLAADPADLDAYDNLAVALEKLGRTAEAIDVMRRKLDVDPDGYTTHANLGTFHLHAGDFDAGIEHIRRALEINPDAHFGRERYQLQLAEFRRDHRDDPPGDYPLKDFLGLDPFDYSKVDGSPSPAGDNAFGRPEQIAEAGLSPDVFDGVVGMIRFGTGTSPDLYYALGNLLTRRGDKLLALRAYQRAIDNSHPRAAEIIALQADLMEFLPEYERFYDYDDPTRGLAAVRGDIGVERAEASAWVAAYRRHEDRLVLAGRDVRDEANYAAFYADHPRSSDAYASTLAERIGDPRSAAGPPSPADHAGARPRAVRRPARPLGERSA